MKGIQKVFRAVVGNGCGSYVVGVVGLCENIANSVSWTGHGLSLAIILALLGQARLDWTASGA